MPKIRETVAESREAAPVLSRKAQGAFLRVLTCFCLKNIKISILILIYVEIFDLFYLLVTGMHQKLTI